MIGKLIVIDGIDGAGKATQTKLLFDRLMREGIAVEKIDFPRYGTPLFGELLGECIVGKHGDFVHLDPKITATIFALDRFEASGAIQKWLVEGKIVIADRFTSANQIHQGGKVIDREKRRAFLSWIEKMEHDVLDIPRPDAIIYLRISVDMSLELLAKERTQKNVAQTTPGKDTLEKDHMYLERSFESAEELAMSPDWHTVECVENDMLRSLEEIHKDVYKIVHTYLVY